MKDSIKICFPERESDLDLLTLPFKSTYRVLSWQGSASGVLLTPDFVLGDLVGKFLIIKSFKIIPYASNTVVDMYVTDGITINQETLPNTSRIDRLFDLFGSGTFINLDINGGPVNLFNATFPIDVDLQNIYFKFPEKLQDITLRINARIFQNIITSAVQIPNLIVNMEVYLI